jgi:mRNA-degrading endonuclease toxin of MazEF toxin-antitoxin module
LQTGNIDAFNSVWAAHKSEYESQPALVASSAAVKEKITLLAVMELAARKPSTERTISFQELAEETRLGVDQVSSPQCIVSTRPKTCICRLNGC